MVRPSRRTVLWLVAAALVVWVMAGTPFDTVLEPWVDSLEEAGFKGMVSFVVVGILLGLLFVPVTLPMTLAGVVYGLVWGVVLASFVLLGTSAIGFWIGNRYWPRLQGYSMFQRPGFQAVSRAIETDGHRMIFLLRMTPFFPFMIGSLFFGSLKLKFWPCLLIGFLGTAPAKFLQVFAGAVAHESYTSPEGASGWEAALFILSVVVFLVVSWRIGKNTQAILKSSKF